MVISNCFYCFMKVISCIICLFHWSATFSMRWVVSSWDENGGLLLLVWGGEFVPQRSWGVSGSLFTMMRRWIIRSAGRCGVSRHVDIASDCQGRQRAGGGAGVVLLLLCVNRKQLRWFSLVPSLWRFFPTHPTGRISRPEKIPWGSGKHCWGNRQLLHDGKLFLKTSLRTVDVSWAFLCHVRATLHI